MVEEQLYQAGGQVVCRCSIRAVATQWAAVNYLPSSRRATPQGSHSLPCSSANQLCKGNLFGIEASIAHHVSAGQLHWQFANNPIPCRPTPYATAHVRPNVWGWSTALKNHNVAKANNKCSKRPTAHLVTQHLKNSMQVGRAWPDQSEAALQILVHVFK